MLRLPRILDEKGIRKLDNSGIRPTDTLKNGAEGASSRLTAKDHTAVAGSSVKENEATSSMLEVSEDAVGRIYI